jgi:hypothetical protein
VEICLQSFIMRCIECVARALTAGCTQLRMNSRRQRDNGDSASPTSLIPRQSPSVESDLFFGDAIAPIPRSQLDRPNPKDPICMYVTSI